jgi:uncharacterized protein (TIGR03792 family)
VGVKYNLFLGGPEMELTKFEKPMAVEHLLFKVKPELVDKFIELDHEIWTKQLSQYPGFVSKEVWVSKSVPGEVATIIYWSDINLWKAIDHHELIETDKKFTEAIGEGNAELYKAWHEESQFYKVTEYK